MMPFGYDWLWLSILGIVCTSYAFAANTSVMRSLSAYHVVLTINLEPIYGIILALIVFNDSEFMSIGFYIGAFLIVLSVFFYPVLKRKLNNKVLRLFKV